MNEQDVALLEAIAIYLFQQHQAPGRKNDVAYQAAWKFIAARGEDLMRPPADEPFATAKKSLPLHDQEP